MRIGWVLMAIVGAIGVTATACSAPWPTPSADTNASGVETSTLKVQRPKDGRTRPLVVVLADNAGTETTDFMVPYAVLKESGAADVVTVSSEAGVVQLMPALSIHADKTMATFDTDTPAGADIVVVPAMHNNSTPKLQQWLRQQSDKGAMIVAICEGAWIAAHAGILDGKNATTHWYALGKIARAFPKTRWHQNRRYVADGQVVTTAGVTASMPASLALIEAIAGRARAKATAERLGVTEWAPEHDSDDLKLGYRDMATAALNTLAFWRHETFEMPVKEGFDEIALALTADAWSRTYRSQAVATNGEKVVNSRHGLRLTTDKPRAGRQILAPGELRGNAALDASLGDISRRYGQPSADFVRLQLEYPKP